MESGVRTQVGKAGRRRDAQDGQTGYGSQVADDGRNPLTRIFSAQLPQYFALFGMWDRTWDTA